jgi:DNA-binding transcriptional ArsR family regulator
MVGATQAAVIAAEGLDEAPEPERVVSDVETLKALSDPLRLKILETMVARVDTAWTAKELAAELGVPQTRLYHHIELLVERDLIRLASQRIVSGIIESRYRIAALSFRLDHRLLSTDPSLHQAGQDLLHTVFDSAREEVARALHAFLATHPESPSGADPAANEPERPMLTRGVAMLSSARAAEFRTRLLALMAEYEADADQPNAVPWGFLIALYRVPPPSSETPEGGPR